jgi:hypothetical protein
MNSQELETAVRLGLNLVVLILQDDAYGMIRWKHAVDKFTWWSYRSTTPKTQGFSSTNSKTASPRPRRGTVEQHQPSEPKL